MEMQCCFPFIMCLEHLLKADDTLRKCIIYVERAYLIIHYLSCLTLKGKKSQYFKSHVWLFLVIEYK